MEKVNVAKILANCPTGMELDCTMYEDVCFDYVDELNIIHCYIQRETHKTALTFNQHGTPNSDIKSKCVIFPKGETTWEGFVPPCEFEDGDIISAEYYDDICIFKAEGNIKGTVDFYCGISGDSDELLIKDVKNQDEHFGEIDEYKLATEEEREKLFQAIKTNGYIWNPKTKTLGKLPKFKVGDVIRRKGDYISGVVAEIYNDYECKVKYKEGAVSYVSIKAQDEYELVHSKFDITTLKPFKSEVLMRSSNTREWVGTIYSHYNNNKFYGCGMCCDQCIPYKGNEHLLGKTDDCDEYFKNW